MRINGTCGRSKVTQERVCKLCCRGFFSFSPSLSLRRQLQGVPFSKSRELYRMEPGERSEEEDEDTQSSGGGGDSGGPRETPLPPEDGDGSGSEEGETSDSGSTNSSSSSSGSSTSSGMAGGSPGDGNVETYSGTLMQTDEFGDHFHVNCAGNAAKFYLNRFARGSIGRCVLFRSRWITPNEFQAISGRQSSKDWKRSIRLRGRCLKEYIAQGLFQEHLKTCACKICSGEAAEHLRLEGEMALAAKRRRLSQADGAAASGAGQGMMYGDVGLQELAHSPTAGVPATKRRKGRGGRVHRVWSPSGEMAQELSDDDEGDEGERGFGVDRGEVGEDEAREKLHRPSSADQVGEFRRRSQRCVERKHTGYRTELGTFSRRPREWDMEEVTDFLKTQGFSQYCQQFMDEGVDGESMFLLKEHHLVERFGLKLGPALKLLHTISCLRHPPI